MKSIFSGLINWKVKESQIHYEFFGPASAIKERNDLSQPKRLAGITECCDDLDINFSKSGIKTQWNPSFGSILEQAEAEGLSPNFSCRSGVCSTCESTLMQGEVTYDPEPLAEVAEGKVLICCSKPISNLEIIL